MQSTGLELDQGEVKVYQLVEPINLVPLLYTAQSFMQTGYNYVYYYDEEAPLLRGAKWEKGEAAVHENEK